ncbi:olfactory receptor 14A16-like [Tachyglossus aculeatus]|uniref:olfactory receptor 14A16-like n=1 Tax=Tachyglossus aculeatus TaxID=9261 RepID=UPI0018F2BA8F|nr:olfactory receptor 14A16-like [Tachyglossus aculeatus]
MAAASWLSGALSAILHTSATFSVPLGGPSVIHQLFCEIPQIIRLSDSSGKIWELIATAFSANLALICFVSIVVSYVRFFAAVLKMPSEESRSKAFSTRLPHLLVVSLFVSTGDAAYLKPVSDSPSALDLLVSIFYSVLPPEIKTPPVARPPINVSATWLRLSSTIPDSTFLQKKSGEPVPMTSCAVYVRVSRTVR